MDELDGLGVGEEGAGLWDVDLGLSVLEVDVDAAVLNCLAVSRWEEDVADLLSIREGSVGHGDLLIVVRVGRGYEELASLESIEVVLDVSFLEGVRPDLLGLAGLVDGGGHLVDVRGGVHILPEGLSVVGVVAAGVGLLTAIVVERDALPSEGEGQCTLEHSCVVVLVQESSVVVVVNEEAQSVHVFELGSLLCDSIFNVVHGLSRTPHVLDSIVHRVVEQTRHVVLVRTNIAGVTIEAFSHLEDSRGRTILSPEVLWYLWDSIDSYAVESISRHELLNPVLQVASYP